jgi:hypothetical protein
MGIVFVVRLSVCALIQTEQFKFAGEHRSHAANATLTHKFIYAGDGVAEGKSICAPMGMG